MKNLVMKNLAMKNLAIGDRVWVTDPNDRFSFDLGIIQGMVVSSNPNTEARFLVHLQLAGPGKRRARMPDTRLEKINTN